MSRFLRAQPPRADLMTLTLAEVEWILGTPLPPGAATQGRAWWSNARRSAQGRAWRSAGWLVVMVGWHPGEPSQQAVTFARVRSETAASPRA